MRCRGVGCDDPCSSASSDYEMERDVDMAESIRTEFDRPELEGRCGICDTLIVDGNCPECYPPRCEGAGDG